MKSLKMRGTSWSRYVKRWPQLSRAANYVMNTICRLLFQRIVQSESGTGVLGSFTFLHEQLLFLSICKYNGVYSGHGKDNTVPLSRWTLLLLSLATKPSTTIVTWISSCPSTRRKDDSLLVVAVLEKSAKVCCPRNYDYSPCHDDLEEETGILWVPETNKVTTWTKERFLPEATRHRQLHLKQPTVTSHPWLPSSFPSRALRRYLRFTASRVAFYFIFITMWYAKLLTFLYFTLH